MNTTPQDPGKLVDREFAEAWRPNQDDKLIGEIVELGARAGYNNELYPIVTVRQDDGTELAFHAFHTVAQNELAKLRPQVGQRIAVRYDGAKQAGDGRSKYHAYRIATDHTPAFSWDAFGDTGEPPTSDVPDDFPTADTGYGRPHAKPKADDDAIPF